MIVSTCSRDFLRKCILVCLLYTVLLPNLLRPNVNFTADVKVDISTKKLHNRKHFLEKSRDHIVDVFFRLHLSRWYPQCKFPTDTMPWKLCILCVNE